MAPDLLFENSFSPVCEVFFVEACILRRPPVLALPLLALDFVDFFGDFDFAGQRIEGTSYSFKGTEMSMSLFS